MEPTGEQRLNVLSLVSNDNFLEKPFKCCQTKTTKILLCVQCGNVFHQSCATRIIYCETDKKLNEADENIQGKLDPSIENKLLKKILKEKDEKFNLLLENNSPLKQNNGYLQEKLNRLEAKTY